MNMQVVFLKISESIPNVSRARLDQTQSSLRAFFHHIAELAG